VPESDGIDKRWEVYERTEHAAALIVVENPSYREELIPFLEPIHRD
jgi:hypothetical protein